MRSLTSFERAGTMESVLAYIEELKAAHDKQQQCIDQWNIRYQNYFSVLEQKLAACEQERDVRWSKDKPILPGQYWYRHLESYEPRVLFVMNDLKGAADYGGYNCMEELSGEWAGPLPMPLEEKA